MTTLQAEQITAQTADFQRYYEEAGPDYASWSPNFNMHFGYYRWGMNPIHREAMLEQMNLEVRNRLHLSPAPLRAYSTWVAVSEQPFAASHPNSPTPNSTASLSSPGSWSRAGI